MSNYLIKIKIIYFKIIKYYIIKIGKIIYIIFLRRRLALNLLEWNIFILDLLVDGIGDIILEVPLIQNIQITKHTKGINPFVSLHIVLDSFSSFLYPSILYTAFELIYIFNSESIKQLACYFASICMGTI